MKIGRVLTVLVLGLACNCYAADGTGETIVKPSSDGKLSINLEFAERCFYGDLDLIQKELNSDLTSRNRIIATIEPISGSSAEFSKSVLEISTGNNVGVKDVLKPNFELSLPAVEKNVLAGLYICKDGDQDQSCAKKTIMGFHEAFKPHDTGSVARKRTTVGDKVYFLRPILITPNGLSIPNIFNEADYKAVLEQAGSEDVANVTSITATAQKLGSAPITVSKDSISVPLPYYSGNSNACKAPQK